MAGRGERWLGPGRWEYRVGAVPESVAKIDGKDGRQKHTRDSLKSNRTLYLR